MEERTNWLLCIVPHLLQYIVAPIELPSIKELHGEVKGGVLDVRTLQRLGSTSQAAARSEAGGGAPAGRRGRGRGRDETGERDAKGKGEAIGFCVRGEEEEARGELLLHDC